MVWLAVIGLAVWVFSLNGRLSALHQEVARLRKSAPALAEAPSVRFADPEAKAAGPEARRPQESVDTITAPRSAVRSDEPARSWTPRASPPPQAWLRRDAVATWLTENALAWIGAGVLALGGALLVGYAAQRGFFTPPIRMGGAVLLALVLLGTGEWLRRTARGHRLAGALASGAGAAILYATIWAAYWLYALLSIGAAAALLGITSLGLLGLAFLHGEPIAILAITGGLIAPAVTGPHHWPAPALTGYFTLVLAAAFATSAARRWGWVGMTAVAGAVLWAATGYADEAYGRAVLLAVAPAVLSLAALAWRRTRTAPAGAPSNPDAFSLLGTVSVTTAGLLLFGLAGYPLANLPLAAAALGAAGLAALAGWAARQRLMHPATQLAAYAAAAAMGFAAQHDPTGRTEVWAIVIVLALAGAGVWTTLGSQPLGRLWATPAALAILIIGSTGNPALPVWAQSGLAAVLLLVAAWTIARRSPAPGSDLALAIWIWCGSASLIAAAYRASDAKLAPLALALVAAGLAVAQVRLKWRGFAAGSLAAAVAVVAAFLAPDLLKPVLRGLASAPLLAGVAAVAAGLVFAASLEVRRAEPETEFAGALSTAALMIAVCGAFLLLRLAAAQPVAGRAWLDPFLESGLRTSLIVGSGLLTLHSTVRSTSRIGRWRGHVLLGIGVLHGLFFEGLAFNPLWASWRPAVGGPPLIDSLVVGFLMPALLLAAAVRRSQERRFLGSYVVAALGSGLLWSLLELRRLFQGASLNGGLDTVGRLEAASYALLALGVAAGLLWVARAAGRRQTTLSPLAQRLQLGGVCMGWAALALSALVFGDLASPWWGPINRPLDSAATAVLLLGLYVASIAATLGLAALTEGRLSITARLVSTGIGFALMNLAIRLAFRGLDMRPRLSEASFETWTFSAAWALFGAGLLICSTVRRNPSLRWAGLAVLLAATGKIFLFDMARLEGVVRAASFLAVGGLLLAAAVATRHLSLGRMPAEPAPAEGVE